MGWSGRWSHRWDNIPTLNCHLLLSKFCFYNNTERLPKSKIEYSVMARFPYQYSLCYLRHYLSQQLRQLLQLVYQAWWWDSSRDTIDSAAIAWPHFICNCHGIYCVPTAGSPTVQFPVLAWVLAGLQALQLDLSICQGSSHGKWLR